MTEDESARVRSLRSDGLARAQIIERTGLPKRLVIEALRRTVPPEWTRRPRAKDELREQAMQLRLDGLSYLQIRQIIHVSKSTLSLWLRDVELTDDQRAALAARRSVTGTRKAADTNRRLRQQRERVIADRAMKDVGAISERELFLVGVALYQAEGSKAKPWSPSCSAVFMNSDVEMIRVYVNWLYLLGIDPTDITCRLHIHESADVPTVERWWRDQPFLQGCEFLRTLLKAHNPKTVRRNVGPDYVGCLIVRVRRSTTLNRRIAGWWKAIVAGADSALDNGWDLRWTMSPDEQAAALQASSAAEPQPNTMGDCPPWGNR